MPTIAILGATGRIGSFTIDDLLNGPFDDGAITILEKIASTSNSPDGVLRKPFRPESASGSADANELSKLRKDIRLKILVRTPSKLPATIREDGRVEVFKGDATNVGDVGKVVGGGKDGGVGVDAVLVAVGAADTKVTTIVSDTVLAVLRALALMQDDGAAKEKKRVHVVVVTSMGINPDAQEIGFWYRWFVKPCVLYHCYVDLKVAQSVVLGVARDGRLPSDGVLGRLRLRNVMDAGQGFKRGVEKLRREVEGRLAGGWLTCTVVQPPQLLEEPGLGRNEVVMALDGNVGLLDADNGTPVGDSAVVVGDVLRNVLLSSSAKAGAGHGLKKEGEGEAVFAGKNTVVAVVAKRHLEGNGFTPQAKELVVEWVGRKVRQVAVTTGVVAAVAAGVVLATKMRGLNVAW
ncbi:hypothetical protein HDU97_008449 [Phlyctochytrium planicorne]|nr:hypothetical protein HDU97_008449 [Phlyctochytrium planicorne]